MIRLDTVTSTMDVVRDLAHRGARPGTAVAAGYQSMGRGRSDHRWIAPPWSSVLMSFLTESRHPPGALGVLSLVWGLAVARTVEALTERPATVKWPNDVLVEGRKISGILVVNAMNPATGRFQQVTGIGLNCRNTPEELPDTGTSLGIVAGAPIAHSVAMQRLLVEVNRVFAAFEAGEVAPLLAGINARLAYRDEAVTVQDGDRLRTGVVDGLHPSGALHLRQPDGSLQLVVAGEVTRGPRPAR